MQQLSIEDKTIIKNSPLFFQIEEAFLSHTLHCLNVQVKQYPSNDYIFFQEDIVDYVGIVLQGEIELLKETYSGNRHIIAILQPSDLFGEGIVCTKARRSPVTVRTKVDSTILCIPYQNIITTCDSSCSFHHQLIYNMMTILGEKNYILNHKIDLLMHKGMKEKIATYLLTIAKQKESKEFTIPLNRNDMAEYLNVSRPSMSRELSRMKKDGLIDYHKNKFIILDKKGLIDCIEE